MEDLNQVSLALRQSNTPKNMGPNEYRLEIMCKFNPPKGNNTDIGYDQHNWISLHLSAGNPGQSCLHSEISTSYALLGSVCEQKQSVEFVMACTAYEGPPAFSASPTHQVRHSPID